MNFSELGVIGDIINEIIIFIKSLIGLFGETEAVISEISSGIAEAEVSMEAITELIMIVVSFLSSIAVLLGSIITILVSTVGFVISIIIAAVCLLAAIAFYIVSSIIFTKLAKKLGYKHPILAWIPIFGDLVKLYMVCDFVNNKPFSIFGGRFKIHNRKLPFIVYVFVKFFGDLVVTTLIALLNLIPVLGQGLSLIASLLYIAVAIIPAIIFYVYARDLIQLFSKDKVTCISIAVILAIASELGSSWTLLIAAFVLLFKKPLPLDPIVIVDAEEVASDTEN